ncbi:MAG TPA: glucose 1-dehydrogenase [Myxococcota bacterium]|jgi:3alpha(or 20beta)-hydroxysteroid dehydrogenase|nr:glucose 1-dehydrogenase [Myxococcota bacterium]
MRKLEGKVALVTGAARGQGEAEARLFVAEGAKVVLGDVLDGPGQAVATELGDGALYRHHDVGSEGSWAGFVAAALDRFGRIDVLVNNAGILHVAPVAEIKLDDYMRVIRVNQVGCLLGMRAVIPHMAQVGGGSIVNVSSTTGMEGAMGLVAYSSSKFAIRGMTKTAALELGRVGIRVNVICPGGIDTPMGRGDEAGFEAVDTSGWYKALPLQRIGQPKEIAKLALFLASDDSSYCTGAEFVADGGQLAGERFA